MHSPKANVLLALLILGFRSTLSAMGPGSEESRPEEAKIAIVFREDLPNAPGAGLDKAPVPVEKHGYDIKTLGSRFGLFEKLLELGLKENTISLAKTSKNTFDRVIELSSGNREHNRRPLDAKSVAELLVAAD